MTDTSNNAGASSDDKKSPVDAAVEMLVFAPLGLALTVRENLPDLVAKGRQQLTGQVAMAKMIGQFAVKEGDRELRKRLEGVSETLSALGILPEPNPASPPPPTSKPASQTAPAPAASTVSNPSNNGVVPTRDPAKSTTTRKAAELSIPGYDTLSASQVVQRLAGLSRDELEAVRDYEAGTRGRRTILSKVAQLQSDAST